MLESLISNFSVIAEWLNDNQGVVGVVIFVATILFGWASGIFSAFRRRPKFKISLIDGPTFCCTFPTGTNHGVTPVHRTGIALYLNISNVGSAATSVDNISVAYHWHVRPFSLSWLRYGVGWFWLRHQTTVIHDFQVKIGENIKLYPFLTQRSFLSGVVPSTFLEVGRSENGVVYFEQSDSWGICYPSPGNGGVDIKIALRDVFGSVHTAKFKIQSISLEDARKYNPSFGKSFSELRNEMLPYDTNI